MSNKKTADIIINRWRTMEIFEGIDNISPEFAQGDILDLAFVIESLRAENGRLRAELDETRSDCNMTAAILNDFRNGNRIMDACFSCGEITEWFRQSTDDGGDNYCTVCGYCPAEEDAEDIPF